MDVKGQSLEIHASGSVVCDPQWTAEALGNVLKNCTEHMENGRITVTAEENAVCTCIRIRDEGGGIDPEDLPHLFERYYKGKNASAQSVGVGLALSRWKAATSTATVLTISSSSPLQTKSPTITPTMERKLRRLRWWLWRRARRARKTSVS